MTQIRSFPVMSPCHILRLRPALSHIEFMSRVPCPSVPCASHRSVRSRVPGVTNSALDQGLHAPHHLTQASRAAGCDWCGAQGPAARRGCESAEAARQRVRCSLTSRQGCCPDSSQAHRYYGRSRCRKTAGSSIRSQVASQPRGSCPRLGKIWL